jgi:hypothetical protein
MKLSIVSAFITISIFGPLSHTQAQQNISIYSTGISTPWYSASSIITDGQTDPHWTMLMPGASTFTSVLVATNNPAWLANNTSSKWINDNGNGSINSPVGNYTYRTTFNISGSMDPAKVQLFFAISSDNSTTAIKLNGVATGLTYGGNFAAMSSSMGIISGFQTGTNTLDFVVNNASTSPNPQGLRVNIISAGVLPEPSALVLALFGSTLCLVNKRRNSSKS